MTIRIPKLSYTRETPKQLDIVIATLYENYIPEPNIIIVAAKPPDNFVVVVKSLHKHTKLADIPDHTVVTEVTEEELIREGYLLLYTAKYAFTLAEEMNVLRHVYTSAEYLSRFLVKLGPTPDPISLHLLGDIYAQLLCLYESRRIGRIVTNAGAIPPNLVNFPVVFTAYEVRVMGEYKEVPAYGRPVTQLLYTKLLDKLKQCIWELARSN